MLFDTDWVAVPEFIDRSDNDDKPIATFYNDRSFSATIECNLFKKEHFLSLLRPSVKKKKEKPRARMIERAKRMRTNFTETFICRKGGNEYVDERSSLRFVLQQVQEL